MSPKDARRAAKPLPEVTEASPETETGAISGVDPALPDQAPVPPARQAQAEPTEQVPAEPKPVTPAPAAQKEPAKKAAPPAKPELPAGLY